jgi:hypothetical protein
MFHFPGLTPPGYFLPPLRGWGRDLYKGAQSSGAFRTVVLLLFICCIL